MHHRDVCRGQQVPRIGAVHATKHFVGVSDIDWFALLRAQPALDEMNVWQSGGRLQFKALQEGELFLFKLHAPHSFIVVGDGQSDYVRPRPWAG